MHWLNLLYIFPICFLLFTVWFNFNFKRRQNADIKSTVKQGSDLTVVVVFKNEATRIQPLLESFDKLSVQPKNYLFIDDHSTDDTVQIIGDWAEGKSIDIVTNVGQGKKEGMLTAARIATGNWLLCTDADCEVSPTWVETAANLIQNEQVNFWVLPVVFKPQNNLISEIDALDCASLIGSTFGVSQKQAFMCNGANLLFQRNKYLGLSVFDENKDLPTGDDLFALFAFKKDNPKNVDFYMGESGFVYTPAVRSVAQFVKQRSRWASKASRYTDEWATFFSWMVFLSAISTLLLAAGASFGMVSWPFFVTVFSVVGFVQGLFLLQVTRYLGVSNVMLAFPLTYLLYNFYIPTLAISGLLHSFRPNTNHGTVR